MLAFILIMFYTYARHIKTRIAIIDKSEQSHHNLGFRTVSTEFLLEPKFNRAYPE